MIQNGEKRVSNLEMSKHLIKRLRDEWKQNNNSRLVG